MPVTVRDVITRALRKAGVSNIGDSAHGEDFDVALDALNDMLFAWKLKGVDTEHVQLSGASTFPLGDEFIEGTVYNLASRISPDYQIPASFDADDWFRAIQAAYTTIAPVSFDAGLQNLPSQRFRRFF